MKNDEIYRKLDEITQGWEAGVTLDKLYQLVLAERSDILKILESELRFHAPGVKDHIMKEMREALLDDCKTPDLVEETVLWAKEMGGSSYPSADMTRVALRHLAERIVSQFKNAPVAQLIEDNEMSADFVERICGLKVTSAARSS